MTFLLRRIDPGRIDAATKTGKTAKLTTLVLTSMALILTGCSSQPGGETETAKESIHIVASTPIWADIAREVAITAAVDVTVGSVISDPNTDPHHFEPTAADVARAHNADITVVGGGGYDAWLYQTLEDQDKIVTALPLTQSGAAAVHTSSSTIPLIDGNEHIWYDAITVDLMAEKIADSINQKDAKANASAAEVINKTASYTQRIANLPARRFAQTEPIADYLLRPSSWIESTPQGYRGATLDEGEPAAADLASFLEIIKNKEIDILISNPQAETSAAKRIRAAAHDAGIPILDIGETPTNGENFFDYYDKIITDLENNAT